MSCFRGKGGSKRQQAPTAGRSPYSAEKPGSSNPHAARAWTAGPRLMLPRGPKHGTENEKLRMTSEAPPSPNIYLL